MALVTGGSPGCLRDPLRVTPQPDASPEDSPSASHPRARQCCERGGHVVGGHRRAFRRAHRSRPRRDPAGEPHEELAVHRRHRPSMPVLASARQTASQASPRAGGGSSGVQSAIVPSDRNEPRRSTRARDASRPSPPPAPASRSPPPRRRARPRPLPARARRCPPARELAARAGCSRSVSASPSPRSASEGLVDGRRRRCAATSARKLPRRATAASRGYSMLPASRGAG